jgi:hypothetical protein
MLRKMWYAAFSADSWFRSLDSADGNLRLAALVLAVSWSAAALAASVALVQTTGSGAYLSVLAFAFAGVLLQGAVLWGAGGFVTYAVGELGVRAFELTGWSWTPLFFISLVMLPAALLAPAIALIVGVPAGLIWHLTVLRKGLEWFGAQRPLLVMLTYIIFVYVLPLGIAGFLVFTFGAPT